MKTVLTSETLYKLDSKGKVRVWYAETGTDGHCRVAMQGNIVTGKQIGRAHV